VFERTHFRVPWRTSGYSNVRQLGLQALLFPYNF
jgi:hypothetical protein